MRCLSYWVRLAFWVSLCSIPTEAYGQGLTPVELTVAGSDANVRALDASLSEALSAAHVRLHATRVTTIEPRSISRAQPSASQAPHLWIDATVTKHATLYLTSADGNQVFVRQFELERGLDPVALELLALVARSSLSAMLAGDSVGVSREEYERSLPAALTRTKKNEAPDAEQSTAGAQKREKARAVRIGGLYELEGLGASAAQHAAGAELEWRPSWFSVGLLVELRAPLRVGSGPLQVRLTSRTAALYVALPVSLSERATLALGGAFGMNWIRVQGFEQAQNATPVAAYSVADSVLQPFASFRYRLGALELSAGLGAELGLVDTRYYLLRGEQRETVFTPWRVRPLARLGFSACF